MDINFDKKTVQIYKELSYQSKIIQEICESVVPDTDEDISCIAAVQSYVLMKSKDISNRGILVSGEACASLIYITDSRDKTSFIKLKKPFSIEFEVGDIDAEALAQVKLNIASAEARLINPRKVSVCFEIVGEMSCYGSEDLSVEYGIPAESCKGLHVKYENAEFNVVSAVREKTFSLNEQFSLPGGKPKPSKIICADAELVIADTQFVGTKVIVKGNAEISLCYLSDEVNYPVKAEFSALFSQIIDMGDEATENCSIVPALTGLYYNIADSIGGDKLVEIELHAVLQLCGRSNRQIVYVSDAYSNLMPATCHCDKDRIKYVSEYRKIKISADERMIIADDCIDVLSMFATLSNAEASDEGVAAAIYIDIIYRDSNGNMASVRRNLTVKSESPAVCYRVNSARLADVYLRPDGQFMDVHLAAEVSLIVCAELELEKLTSIRLDEENIYELKSFPTVTLVRCSGETVWELAKTYHSSTEKINEVNDIDGELNGRMLLVPKCI